MQPNSLLPKYDIWLGLFNTKDSLNCYFRNGSFICIFSPFFEMVPHPCDTTSDFRNGSYLPEGVTLEFPCMYTTEGLDEKGDRLPWGKAIMMMMWTVQGEMSFLRCWLNKSCEKLLHMRTVHRAECFLASLSRPDCQHVCRFFMRWKSTKDFDFHRKERERIF